MLESVDFLADEIVVGVDSRTTDDSLWIAQRFGAKTFCFEWRDDFSYARNLTLDLARGRWILVIDADERVTDEGAVLIRQILQGAVETPPDEAPTGFVFLMAQRSLDGELRGLTRSSGRLWRNRPEVRYRGVVHEEPWWTPDRDKTCWISVAGVIALDHYGYDEAVWKKRKKRQRNIRLLKRRVRENPEDMYAREKLALQESTDAPYTVLTGSKS